MQALALCFADHHEFVNDFEFALAEMTSNTSDGLIKGLEMFTSKVKYLHINLKECKDSLNDLEAVQTWVSMYLPKEDLSATIMSEVSTHLDLVKVEILRAKKDMAYKNYFGLGQTIGELLTHVLTPQVMPVTVYDTFELKDDSPQSVLEMMEIEAARHPEGQPINIEQLLQ